MNFSFFGYDFSISEVISVSVSLFLAVFYGLKTHDIKKFLKEVNEIMYKFKTLQNSQGAETEGQTFDRTKPVYRLNKSTGSLEKTDEKVDIIEMVQSCVQTTLESILERYLPNGNDKHSQDVYEYDRMQDDLDMLMNAGNRLDAWREKLGLSEFATFDDIQKAILQAHSELGKKIYGGVDDEKTSQKSEDVEESKQG